MHSFLANSPIVVPSVLQTARLGNGKKLFTSEIPVRRVRGWSRRSGRKVSITRTAFTRPMLRIWLTVSLFSLDMGLKGRTTLVPPTILLIVLRVLIIVAGNVVMVVWLATLMMREDNWLFVLMSVVARLSDLGWRLMVVICVLCVTNR